MFWKRLVLEVDMNKNMCVLIMAALFGGLVACGGGGGSGSNTVVDQSFGGLWSGTLTVDGSSPEEYFAITTDDGRFQFFTDDTRPRFIGTAQVSGSDTVGSGQGYAAIGETWSNSLGVTPVTIDATLVGSKSLTGTWTTTSGESGSFNFSYEPEYENNSALTLLEDVWVDDLSMPFVTFTIAADGQFFAQNAIGCTTNGQFSIVDASVDVYAVTSTIANCPLAGDYIGLATLGEVVDPDDTLLLVISNDDQALVLLLER